MSPNLGSHTNKQNDSPSTEGPRPRRQLIDLGGLFKADAKPKIDWESGDYVDVALSMTVSDKTKVHAIIKELVATKQPLTRDNLHQMKEQRIAQIKTKVAARKDHGKEGDSGEEDEDKEENEEEDEQQEHLDDQNDSDSGSSANDEADRQLKRHRIFDHRIRDENLPPSMKALAEKVKEPLSDPTLRKRFEERANKVSGLRKAANGKTAEEAQNLWRD